MARFTVADCMENIDNRFIMTLTASRRAREIEDSNETRIDEIDNDKAAVLALREIANKSTTTDILNGIE